MPIDTRFPWMAQQRWHQSDGVSRDIQAGMQIGQQQRQINQREREFAALQEYRTSQLRSLAATREAQINTQLMRQKQIEAEATDAAIVSEWMRDPRQPPPTGLQTPKGLKAVADVQKVFAQTEIGSKFAAADKAFADQIKDLDAMGALRVKSAMDASNGSITPEIATLIDTETTRVKGLMADARILDDYGQPFTPGGERKPTFIQSLKTGGIQRLPQQWDGNAIPLTDVDGNVMGYGVRNASGGITQLREHKEAAVTMPPERRAAMNVEMKAVSSWWDGLTVKERAKPDNQAELKRKIAEVEGKYSSAPAPAAAAPNDFQKTYDALPSGSRYTAPDGSMRIKR